VVASPPRLPQAGGVSESLNPLHCGAVVASTPPPVRRRRTGGVSIPFIAGQWSLLRACLVQAPDDGDVSIPFIAGQWSLQFDAGALITRLRRLNPLHCGAVVASRRPLVTGARLTGAVSIPFIAGQWSLRGASRLHIRPARWSQSPSLRGSGRFRYEAWHTPRTWTSQSPSLRGSGRFERAADDAAADACQGLNPLHCGAVVASAATPRGARRRPARLNPLHCGAVVASFLFRPLKFFNLNVSIPFIAGQWSLPTTRSKPSPGSGQVSIPFIAGQWSLR